jgi:hypothetical protein
MAVMRTDVKTLLFLLVFLYYLCLAIIHLLICKVVVIAYRNTLFWFNRFKSN